MRQPALQPTALLDPAPKWPPGRGGRSGERTGLETGSNPMRPPDVPRRCVNRQPPQQWGHHRTERGDGQAEIFLEIFFDRQECLSHRAAEMGKKKGAALGGATE